MIVESLISSSVGHVPHVLLSDAFSRPNEIYNLLLGLFTPHTLFQTGHDFGSAEAINIVKCSALQLHQFSVQETCQRSCVECRYLHAARARRYQHPHNFDHKEKHIHEHGRANKTVMADMSL